MAHDSYFCKKFPGEIYPYPSQRRFGAGNFIGAITTNNDSITGSLPLTKEFECPQECRPKDHTEWKHC